MPCTLGYGWVLWVHGCSGDKWAQGRQHQARARPIRDALRPCAGVAVALSRQATDSPHQAGLMGSPLPRLGLCWRPAAQCPCADPALRRLGPSTQLPGVQLHTAPPAARRPVPPQPQLHTAPTARPRPSASG